MKWSAHSCDIVHCVGGPSKGLSVLLFHRSCNCVPETPSRVSCRHNYHDLVRSEIVGNFEIQIFRDLLLVQGTEVVFPLLHQFTSILAPPFVGTLSANCISTR